MRCEKDKVFGCGVLVELKRRGTKEKLCGLERARGGEERPAERVGEVKVCAGRDLDAFRNSLEGAFARVWNFERHPRALELVGRTGTNRSAIVFCQERILWAKAPPPGFPKGRRGGMAGFRFGLLAQGPG